MSWLCWHIGTTTDPKFGAVAKRCGNVPKHLVVAVWAHLLERAFEANDKGSIAGIDTEDVAIALDCTEEQVSAIIEAMAAKGLIADEKISNWIKRQNATSTERVKRFREKKKQDEMHETVSAVSETHETGTDKQTDIQTDKQTEKETRAPKARRDTEPEGFAEWYEAFPRHEARGDAARAYAKARKEGLDPAGLLVAAQAYAKTRIGEDPKFTKLPATWLNKKCWLDEGPKAPAEPTAVQRVSEDARLEAEAWKVRKRMTNFKVSDDDIREMLKRSLVTHEEAKAFGFDPDAELLEIPGFLQRNRGAA